MADRTGSIKIFESANGDAEFPITHERAVRDSGGTTLETKLTKLTNSLLAVYSSLGEYAFPDGKPSIPISDVARVRYELSAVSSSNNTTSVLMNSSYSTTLSVLSNLYVIDTTTLSVTMDGVDITSSAYSGGVISIPVVTGDVVITASAITYPSGIVFHLDGLNKGSDNAVWTDTVGGVEFALSDCTFGTDHVLFDLATSQGVSYSQVFPSFSLNDSTIECCFKLDANPSESFCILYHGYNNAIGFNWVKSYSRYTCAVKQTNGISFSSTPTTNIVSASFALGSGMVDGVNVNADNIVYFTPYSGNACFIGNNAALNRSLLGRLYSLRIYNKKLTSQEMAQSYMVDRGRFNF